MPKIIISVTEIDEAFFEKVFQHIKDTPKLKQEVQNKLRK